MEEVYKDIINNLRQGYVDQRELNSLEYMFDQMRDKSVFYDNLIKERDKHMEHLDQGTVENNCKIKRMQSHIDCLKAELAKVHKDKLELPEEPIRVAEMLICATDTYKNILNKEQIYRIYDKSELKQIAEHLLVYCNHAEVEQ